MLQMTIKMEKTASQHSAFLGRRLLFLMVLAVLLISALTWMSIYLFNPISALGLDELVAMALELQGIDTLLPRIL